MSQSMRRQMTGSRGAVVFGILWVLSVCRMGLATDIPSPASVNDPADPVVLLNQTGNGDGAPPYQWNMIGNEFNYTINNATTGVIPFVIEANAPNSSLYLRGDSAGIANVGIGRFPDDGVTLQVNAPITPIIRMASSSYDWDLRANQFEWYVWDNDANTYPFVIQSGAPSNSIAVKTNGSIGLGTASPNVIGATTGTGRFLNLRADGAGAAGVANLVAQGNLGSQMHLVHNNAPANQRIIRFQCSSGLASFHVLNDSLATYAIQNAFNIKMSNGNIGLRVASPAHPLHLASGAHCTAAGVWTNASSRELKQDIEPITSEQARETVRALQPVSYRYKNEPDEKYVGFIAEDVPELVATNDRKSLAPMDVVAVLTKVVQDQERTITRLEQSEAAHKQLLASFRQQLADLEAKVK